MIRKPEADCEMRWMNTPVSTAPLMLVNPAQFLPEAFSGERSYRSVSAESGQDSVAEYQSADTVFLSAFRSPDDARSPDEHFAVFSGYPGQSEETEEAARDHR